MDPIHRLRPDRPVEFPTAERCHITELVNNPRLADVSLARARVEPGVVTELHALPVREIYVVLSGRGVIDSGDDAGLAVEADDAVVIPAGTPQRIRNVGKEDLVFLCLCTPRFEPDGYVALEPRGAG